MDSGEAPAAERSAEHPDATGSGEASTEWIVGSGEAPTVTSGASITTGTPCMPMCKVSTGHAGFVPNDLKFIPAIQCMKEVRLVECLVTHMER